MHTIMEGRVAFITKQQSPLVVTTATQRARASILGHVALLSPSLCVCV